MKMKIMLRCLIMLAIVAGVSSMAFGADPNWIGAVDTNWHVGGNWDTGFVPTAIDNVKIGDPNYTDPPANRTYPIIVVIDANSFANSISIGAGTTVSEDTTVNLKSGLLTVGFDLTIGMAGDGGQVTFIANSNSVIGDGLKVGDYAGSDGVIDANNVNLDVAGDIRVGEDGTGKATLNNVIVAGANRLRVGAEDGDGTLILNGSSRIDIVSIGRKQDSKVGGGAGTLEMNDTSSMYIDKGDDNNDLRVASSSGIGTIEMNDDSYIWVEGVFKASGSGTSDATITMTGGTIYVHNKAYFGGKSGGDHTRWNTGDNTRGVLTMSGDAVFETNNQMHFGEESDPDKVGSADRNQLIMNDNAFIDVDDGDDMLHIAENAGSYVYVEVNDDAVIKCQDLEIGRNGGGCDFTVNDGSLNIKDHFLVASSVDDANFVDPVNILIENNGRIDIENRFRVGGNGAQVLIAFKKGVIDMPDSDDELAMPYNGPSLTVVDGNGDYVSGGYAIIELGVDADGISSESAEFKLDGPLDSSDAGVKDYLDFLGGGILKMHQNKVPEQDIKDHIVSGYFRTTYSQTSLDGETPADPNCFRPVYSSEDGGIRWDVELGIGLICVDPPAGDLDDDCDVDLDDLAILAASWTTTYYLEDFADMSASWGKCGKAYGYSCP